jgi:hypothetical protein
VRDRVAVNGLILSPVDCKVCLAVTVQIEVAHSDVIFDRLLEDPGSHDSAVPLHFSGKTGVH